MPAKPSKRTRAAKKPARKKPGFNRLVLILLAVVMLLTFILYSVYSPKTTRGSKDSSVSSMNKPPAFRKDGIAKILSSPSPVTVDVEIADNQDTRMKGLMYRYSMRENQGMFFIFPQEDYRSFWMKNTHISLDIIYINANMEIVSIQKYTQPESTYSLPSEKPAKYVLEVNAGFSDKFKLKVGDKIEF